MSKSDKIKKLCQENQIRMIDFKMVDLDGRWRAVEDPFAEIPTLTMCGDVCVIGKENKPFDQ